MLDLSENRLTSIPDWLSESPQLAQLFLRGNNIADLPSKVDRVEVLDLAKNQLRELPDLKRWAGLRILRLADNELSEIPSWIGRLTGLTQLELDRNHLSDLPEEMSALAELTHLSLGGNLVADLGFQFDRLPKLQNLNLFDNQLRWVPASIERTRLQHLNLNGNPLAELPAWLRELPSLQVVLSALASKEFQAILRDRRIAARS